VPNIRQVRPDDLEALYGISRATGHAGGDASHLYATRAPAIVARLYPAHLPRLQGRGVGTKLFGCWTTIASAREPKAIHVAIRGTGPARRSRDARRDRPSTVNVAYATATAASTMHCMAELQA